jgi:pimeloyl-ACP methyl ester carboxylesterase
MTMTTLSVESHFHQSDRHTTHYLAAGPTDGPLIIFTHGWPELSLSWRHQLPFFAALGFRAIAPDMRGYGKSSVYDRHEDYSQEEIIQDMVELIDSLGQQKALWVGHDWGAPVAWNMASHHPDRCHAVANLCVPYATLERGLDTLIEYVDRDVYPLDQYPAGQWEYMRFYEDEFAKSTAPMDANPHNMAQAIFRKGTADGTAKPSGTAMVYQQGGWFGGLAAAPEVPRDVDLITEDELAQYVESLERNGFFGPNSWYMNHKHNAAFSKQVKNDGKLKMPVLFLAARFDYTCETVTSRLAEPMREYCSNLSEVIIDSGHWMAQEQPFAVNREIARWIFREVSELTEFENVSQI